MEENFIAHLEETLTRCNKAQHTLMFTRPVTLVNGKWYADGNEMTEEGLVKNGYARRIQLSHPTDNSPSTRENEPTATSQEELAT